MDFCIVTALNFAIAAFLTYLVRIGFGFYENLVFSLCIGTLTWLFIDLGRLALWGANSRPPIFRFFLLCLVSIPAGRILGDMLAVRILGIPAEAHGTIWEQNAVRFFIVTFMISIAIIWFFWNRGKVNYLIALAETEKARAAAIEKQALQAQLQLLQAQIEPHMLFNTLANLQGLIAVDPARAQHMLDQFILYLRATLSSSRAEQTTLAQEFSLLEAYLGLMSVRMGSRLSYSLQLPEELRNTVIPPMLLQPLVENAIKHGLEPKMEGGRIEVCASAEAGVLKLAVADTGLGLDEPNTAVNVQSGKPNSTHVGLDNIRERLLALYGQRASLLLTANSPSGVLAQLSIPI
jgi:signal transduction histidine kinase